MKKFVLAAAAAVSVVAAAAPADAAQFGRNDGRGRFEQVQRTRIVRRDNGRQVIQVRQVQSHRWSKGQRFDRRYARDYRLIQNPRSYRLREAPRGYRWVRSGNDAVLVAVASGIIGAVLANIF